MDGQGLWTLDQLAEQVGAALSVDYPGAPSGRVRSVPDRRAIRWYTTIGLVDRPASMRGRTALYAERHLLQLVAIKRLQAEGRSLADIQAELAGAPESTLRSLARLPDHPPGPAVPAAAPRNDRFWSATTADVSQVESISRLNGGRIELDQVGPGGHVGGGDGVDVAPAIALPGGVMVLLPPGTPYPGAADLNAIRAAAVPLLAELGRRGVIATDFSEG